jgi:hypothetical protein
MLDGPEAATLPEDRPMNAPTVESIREGVLRRMERQANTIRLLIVGAAGVEALLLALALRIADLKNPTHVLIVVTSVLGYSTIFSARSRRRCTSTSRSFWMTATRRAVCCRMCCSRSADRPSA